MHVRAPSARLLMLIEKPKHPWTQMATHHAADDDDEAGDFKTWLLAPVAARRRWLLARPRFVARFRITVLMLHVVAPTICGMLPTPKAEPLQEALLIEFGYRDQAVHLRHMVPMDPFPQGRH